MHTHTFTLSRQATEGGINANQVMILVRIKEFKDSIGGMQALM